MKKLLQSPLFQQVLGRCLGAYMWLVGATTRWERIGGDIRAAAIAGGAVVPCFWHGRILLAHACWMHPGPAPKTSVLISQSNEGNVVSLAAGVVGVASVRGSKEKAGKSKGAFDAMRGMMRQLKAGGAMCVTPDGPRGPRMRAEMGAIQIAKLSGAPLVCMAWSTRRTRLFNSWDRFAFPWPFDRGVIVFGGPLYVARDADDATMEAQRVALENELIRVTQEADRRAGLTPVEPAEAGSTAARRVEPSPA